MFTAQLHRSYRRLFAQLAGLVALAWLTIGVAARLPAITLNDGDLIVSDTQNSQLVRVDFGAGTAEVITSSNLMTGTSGVNVHRPTGSIYTTNQLNTTGTGLYGRIIRVDIVSGTPVQTLVADGRGTDGVFGGIDGKLRYPRLMAFANGGDGPLYVAERNSMFDSETPRNGIVRFDPSDTNFNTNTQDVRIGTFGDPLGIEVAPEGHIFLGSRTGDNLYYIPGDGSSQTSLDALITGDVAGVGGLAAGTIDVDGHITSLFVAEFSAARTSRIDFVYSGDTIISGTRTEISTGTGGNPMNSPTDLAYDEFNDILYVTDNAVDGVYRILDPFGSPTTSFLDLISASGGAIDSSFAGNGIDVFYFTPPYVPEPSASVLLAFGLFGFAVRFRQRRRRA